MAHPTDAARPLRRRVLPLHRHAGPLRHRPTGPVPHQAVAGRVPARLELVPLGDHLRLRQLPPHPHPAALVPVRHQLQRRHRRPVPIPAARQGHHVHHPCVLPAALRLRPCLARRPVCGQHPCPGRERYE